MKLAVRAHFSELCKVNLKFGFCNPIASLSGEFAMPCLTGVDGLIAIMKSGNTGCAFFRGSVDRFKENLEPNFFVLFYHL